MLYKYFVFAGMMFRFRLGTHGHLGTISIIQIQNSYHSPQSSRKSLIIDVAQINLCGQTSASPGESIITVLQGEIFLLNVLSPKETKLK